jgi:uncharacterized membrane-anchored protein
VVPGEVRNAGFLTQTYATISTSDKEKLSKFPELTLMFRILKIAAATEDQTGDGAVTMSMNLGYFVGTFMIAAIFLIAVLI